MFRASFENTRSPLTKRWEEEIVFPYQELKTRLETGPLLSESEYSLLMRGFIAAYLRAITSINLEFFSSNTDKQKEQTNFVSSAHASLKINLTELRTIYESRQAEYFYQHVFFKPEQPTLSPPTLDDQLETRQIFPDNS